MIVKRISLGLGRADCDLVERRGQAPLVVSNTAASLVSCGALAMTRLRASSRRPLGIFSKVFLKGSCGPSFEGSSFNVVMGLGSYCEPSLILSLHSRCRVRFLRVVTSPELLFDLLPLQMILDIRRLKDINLIG